MLAKAQFVEVIMRQFLFKKKHLYANPTDWPAASIYMMHDIYIYIYIYDAAGIMGGIIGGLFISFNIKWCRYRKKSPLVFARRAWLGAQFCGWFKSH